MNAYNDISQKNTVYQDNFSQTPKSSHRVNYWKWLFFGFLLIAIFFSLFVYLGWRASKGDFDDMSSNTTRPSIGQKDAQIVIIEFADFQCPYCSKESHVIKKVLDRYKGLIRLEYRHFPLFSIHPRAVSSAIAAECAHLQGKFWDYHDELYLYQQSLSDKDLLKHARSVGLDTGIFWECFTSKKTLGQVNKDYQEGIKLGVESTPAFYVGGQIIEGAFEFEHWQELIQNLTEK